MNRIVSSIIITLILFVSPGYGQDSPNISDEYIAKLRDFDKKEEIKRRNKKITSNQNLTIQQKRQKLLQEQSKIDTEANYALWVDSLTDEDIRLIYGYSEDQPLFLYFLLGIFLIVLFAAFKFRRKIIFLLETFIAKIIVITVKISRAFSGSFSRIKSKVESDINDDHDSLNHPPD